jgi:uncharacterized membrane protein
MNFQILIGLVLSMLPVVELRVGLPIIVEYVLKNNMSIWPWFILVLILNILVIFIVFAFLDLLHDALMGWRFYKGFMEGYLTRLRKKAERVEKRMDNWGFVALTLFVSIPLPGTGAWTGSFIAWLLGLDRLKSFISIATGVIIAGFLVLFASLGFFSLF